MPHIHGEVFSFHQYLQQMSFYLLSVCKWRSNQWDLPTCWYSQFKDVLLSGEMPAAPPNSQTYSVRVANSTLSFGTGGEKNKDNIKSLYFKLGLVAGCDVLALMDMYVTIHAWDDMTGAVCPRKGSCCTKAPPQALMSVLFCEDCQAGGDHRARRPAFREQAHPRPTLPCFLLLPVKHNPLLNVGL